MWPRNFSCLLIRRQLKFLDHIVSEKGVAIQIRKSLKQWECGQPLLDQCMEVRRLLGLCMRVPTAVELCYPRCSIEKRRWWRTTVMRWVVQRGSTASQDESSLHAVVKSVQHFHPYLYGRHFTICTDHAALRWLLSFRNPEGQIARWLECLQQYDFEIQHRAGTKHRNADALSRRPCSPDCRHCDRLEDKESSAQVVIQEPSLSSRRVTQQLLQPSGAIRICSKPNWMMAPLVL